MRSRVPRLGAGERPAVAVDQLGFARYEADKRLKQLIGCGAAHSRRSKLLKNSANQPGHMSMFTSPR